MSFVMRSDKSSLSVLVASKIFLKAGLVNLAAALLITSPVLIPRMAFPILLTQWGSIYMVIGYFSFLVVGVIGFFGWSIAYYLLNRLYGAEQSDRGLTYAQLITSIIGIYGLATALFLAGYLGSSAVYRGEPVVAAGLLMETFTIPAGISIALTILGNLLGLINLLTSLRRRARL